MFDRIHARGVGAALALSVLAACGGSDSGDTASMLKATRFAVFKHDDGQAFGQYDAGSVTDAPRAGARLALGADQGTDLAVADAATFTLTASNTAFHVFSRLRGAVLMLCDLAAASTGRYAAIAITSADGAPAATAVYDAGELARQTLYEVTHCAYRSGSEAQPQATAHDARTNTLSVDANGDVSISGPAPARIAADDFTSQLHGIRVDNARYSAFKFNVDGDARYVVVERASPDEIDRRAGVVTLWLPE